MRLVQFLDEQGCRRVAVPTADGLGLRCVSGFDSTYEMAFHAIRAGRSLQSVIGSALGPQVVDYGQVIADKRILPPLDHPDPARCLVSLTGLTHLGSARSRDQMHAQVEEAAVTDSIRMFRIGLAGGRPPAGAVGAQPEWAYKGDGRSVVPPERPILQPAFACDGGEEAEIAGLYVIDLQGVPCRVGFALGNEFSDHALEKQNYLYLAHSKLRCCSFGPELLLGELPPSVSGTVRILRDGREVWTSTFESGEAHMCHSIPNLEHHHFKYGLFRRPGDVHVHFFGADSISFGAAVRALPGDLFEISSPVFGRPLRNPLEMEPDLPCVVVKTL